MAGSNKHRHWLRGMRTLSFVGLALIIVLAVGACSPGSGVTSGSIANSSIAATNTPPPATRVSDKPSATATRVRPSATPVPTRVRPSATPTPRRSPTPASTQVSCAGVMVGGGQSRIPSISLVNLIRCRPQAQLVIATIKSDGRFRYSQDDATFQNRERLLPSMASGSYREYTVITPGESDRGARRIITAGDPRRQPSEYKIMYYTDDHYDSFWKVIE